MTRVLAAVLVVSAVLLHAELIVRLDFDGENSMTEAESLAGLQSARAGQTVYRDFSKPPHVLAQYTPLFYYVPGMIARWLGASWTATGVVGRAYAYVFWLLTGLAIFKLARQAGAQRRWAALGAMLWLAGNLAPQWANSYRPDSAALFFSLAGLWAYRRAKRPADFAAAIGLLVAAFLHKQSAIAALAAILLDAYAERQFARAVAMGAAWLAVVSLAVVVAEALSGGALACTAVPSEKCARLLRWYFCLALVLGFVTSGKSGSWANYYLEPAAAGCVLSAVLINYCQSRRERLVAQTVRWSWLVVALAFSSDALVARLRESPVTAHEWIHHRAVRDESANLWRALGNQLSDLQEPVLIENLQVAYRGGGTPFMLNAGVFASMRAGGVFDDTDVLRRIERGEFTGIVAMFPLEAAARVRPFPARWLEPMRAAYRLENVFAQPKLGITNYVYRPSPRVDGDKP
jgi:hypothetical protein